MLRQPEPDTRTNDNKRMGRGSAGIAWALNQVPEDGFSSGSEIQRRLISDFLHHEKRPCLTDTGQGQ